MMIHLWRHICLCLKICSWLLEEECQEFDIRMCGIFSNFPSRARGSLGMDALTRTGYYEYHIIVSYGRILVRVLTQDSSVISYEEYENEISQAVQQV